MSYVDDESKQLSLKDRVKFFEKAFSTETLAKNAQQAPRAHEGTPTHGIVKETICRLTSPKRARESAMSENVDPQQASVSPGKVKISVQLFSAAPEQQDVQPPISKRRRMDPAASENVANCEQERAAEPEVRGEDRSESQGHEMGAQTEENDLGVPQDPSSHTAGILSRVRQEDEEGDATQTAEGLQVGEDPAPLVRKEVTADQEGRALNDDFNKLCIRINVDPTDEKDESYSLKFKLRVVLHGLRKNLSRRAFERVGPGGEVTETVNKCFSGSDVVLWLTFHALEAFRAREGGDGSQQSEDRLSSLSHSTALLVAERLIELRVLYQVNSPTEASEPLLEPLQQLMAEDSVFRFADWAEATPIAPLSDTPCKGTPGRKRSAKKPHPPKSEEEGEGEGTPGGRKFQDALSPGEGRIETGKGHLPITRSLVPSTRSGKKRKMDEGAGEGEA